jgi:hypothetical protein
LIKRDKANLDIFWLRDDSLGDSSDLPDPAVLAAEIVEDLQAALDQFAQIAADLGRGRVRDRARGLKRRVGRRKRLPHFVSRPARGAWIETPAAETAGATRTVARRGGARRLVSRKPAVDCAPIWGVE